MGSIISSEQTAAAEGKLGNVRRDPFAMLPFCGYNMADYWGHWLNFRNKMGYSAPKIFYVNWFRKDEQTGQFLWPGFGENCRVLKWITERIGRNPTGKASMTPIGLVPTLDAIDVGGLDIGDDVVKSLLSVSSAGWQDEIQSIRDYYQQFGQRLPCDLSQELDLLESRLAKPEQAPPTTNKHVLQFVEQIRRLCEPNRVYWCNGSEDEYEELCNRM
jgi:phosphoenolpyruvate carboxykinase (GTP)